MVWKETSAVEERMGFVSDWRGGQASMAALCRAYGISRPTGYKWLARWEEHGRQGLEDRSRAPLSHRQAMGADVERMLVEVRMQHPDWGPRKLVDWLVHEHGREVRWPAASTVGELLKRRGLVHERRRRRRATPSAGPLEPGGEPNDLWCADFKGWFPMGNGRRCEPLTISDHATRYLLRCHAAPGTHLETARPVFEAAFRDYGLPVRIRTDNGAPFGSVGLLGLSRLSVWWIRLGIEPERIQPGHPEQNGRHERIHRTLKQNLACREPARHLRAAQELLVRFRQEYNDERPHEALDGRRPAELYGASPRAYPARLAPVDYPLAMHKRRVLAKGAISWHNNLIFLSEVLGGQWVGLEWIDDRTLRIRFAQLHLADYDTAAGRIRYADGRTGAPSVAKGRQGRRMELETV